MTRRGTKMLSTNPQHVNKPNLFIEVRLNDSFRDDPCVRIDDIRREVASWLNSSFMQVKVHQQLDLRSLNCDKFIDSLDISGHSRSKEFPDDNFHVLSENNLEVAVYLLFSNDDDDCSTTGDEDDNGNEYLQQFTITRLPHQSLDGLWRALVYDKPIGEYTLRTLTRSIKDRQDTRVHHVASPWQNTILFYGPPGSGKSTLAQALAQRLSIRLSNIYTKTKLLQINSHALFSRYFGESSKQIGRLFESIMQMSQDDSQLTVVIFDEIETLASSREKALQTNEVGDAIRSTNELLQGLDRFCKRANVVFICTSNLVCNMDPAFLDRCFYEQKVDIPIVECAYEILRSEINMLVQDNFVSFDSLVFKEGHTLEHTTSDNYSTFGSSQADSSGMQLHSPGTPSRRHMSDSYELWPDHSAYIPDITWASLHWPSDAVTAASELQKIAHMAHGMSGRKLRGLVTLARYKYTVDEPCELQELLLGLERVIREKVGHGNLQPLEQQEDVSSEGNHIHDCIMELVSKHAS